MAPECREPLPSHSPLQSRRQAGLRPTLLYCPGAFAAGFARRRPPRFSPVCVRATALKLYAKLAYDHECAGRAPCEPGCRRAAWWTGGVKLARVSSPMLPRELGCPGLPGPQGIHPHRTGEGAVAPGEGFFSTLPCHCTSCLHLQRCPRGAWARLAHLTGLEGDEAHPPQRGPVRPWPGAATLRTGCPQVSRCQAGMCLEGIVVLWGLGLDLSGWQPLSALAAAGPANPSRTGSCTSPRPNSLPDAPSDHLAGWALASRHASPCL